MHTVTNEKLAKSRFRLGTSFHIAALVVLAIGMFVSLQAPADPNDTVRLLMPYVSILVFLIPYFFGRNYIQRYGPRNRQDQLLIQAAKGLDDRFTLLSFPPGKLPDYLLIGPSGVTVLVTRAQAGTIAAVGDRWRREGVGGFDQIVSTLWGVPMGNPARDVAEGVNKVEQALQARLPEMAEQVPVQGLVVLTNPQARLRLDNATVSATVAKNLKTAVRGTKGGLNKLQLARVREALAAESTG